MMVQHNKIYRTRLDLIVILPREEIESEISSDGTDAVCEEFRSRWESNFTLVQCYNSIENSAISNSTINLEIEKFSRNSIRIVNTYSNSNNLLHHNDLIFDSILTKIGDVLENPEGEVVFLNEIVAKKAIKVLMLLKEMGYSPPNLLVQEPDELMFTWQTDKSKLYLAVFDSEIGFFKLGGSTSGSQEVVICEGEDVDAEKLIAFFLTLKNAEQ